MTPMVWFPVSPALLVCPKDMSETGTRFPGVARARSDIANTALRIFLQELGVAYDEQRGLSPYDGKKHFLKVRAYFDERCCYCGDELVALRVAQDHLTPMNKASLGLHAWGNVVPACQDCNAKKQGREWHAYLVQRAGVNAGERYQRVVDFVREYRYDPDLSDLRSVAEELYEEVGLIAMTLVATKIKRARGSL